jgi:exodeoxyribonuclease V alpha subunit
MTIHKSQGSEFNRVHLLFPKNDSPVLTRELIYTGITRAREKVDIWGNDDVFVGAVSRRTDRKSGLKEALWSGNG